VDNLWDKSGVLLRTNLFVSRHDESPGDNWGVLPKLAVICPRWKGITLVCVGIMNPAMMVAWVCGLLMIGFGVLDFGSVWAWAKILAVIAMTGFHIWLGKQRKAVATGVALTGRQYRMANEIPTVLMLVILVAIIVRPF